jgi:AcrR family transcriptional regulator
MSQAKSKPVNLRISQRIRRTQQSRSEEARAKLLAASIDLICERGFAQTTMADIAQRAGLTRGAIQHHFSGRDELVLAIIHSVEARIIASFDAVAPKGVRDLGERIDHLIDSLGAISVSPAYLAVIDIWIATRADVALGAAIRASTGRSSEAFKRLWLRVFADDVNSDVVDECRRVVVNLMRGIVITQALIPSAGPPGHIFETCKAMVRHHMLKAR